MLCKSWCAISSMLTSCFDSLATLRKIIRFNLKPDMTHLLLCIIYNALAAGYYLCRAWGVSSDGMFGKCGLIKDRCLAVNWGLPLCLSHLCASYNQVCCRSTSRIQKETLADSPVNSAVIQGIKWTHQLATAASLPAYLWQNNQIL